LPAQKKHRLNESEEGGDGAPQTQQKRETDTHRDTEERETEKEVRGGRERGDGDGVFSFISSLTFCGHEFPLSSSSSF